MQRISNTFVSEEVKCYKLILDMKVTAAYNAEFSKMAKLSVTWQTCL